MSLILFSDTRELLSFKKFWKHWRGLELTGNRVRRLSSGEVKSFLRLNQFRGQVPVLRANYVVCNQLTRLMCASLLLLTVPLHVGCASLSSVPFPPPPGAAAGAAGAAGAAAAPAAGAPPTTAQAGGTTIVAVAPPAQPCCKMTLPQWLGLTNCCAKIQGLLGFIPGLLGIFAPGMGQTLSDMANQPPLLPINSPANLQSSNPAVATAAQVANEEGQAKQKIAAIQYLGKIGCAGCYPDVEMSLLASLDDCTESVRYAAAKALHDSSGNPCRLCNSKACCSQAVREKLTDVAYGTKDETCFKESSPRVRRMARLALTNCGGNCYPVEELIPIEGPSMAPPTPASKNPPGSAPVGGAPKPATTAAFRGARQVDFQQMIATAPAAIRPTGVPRPVVIAAEQGNALPVKHEVLQQETPISVEADAAEVDSAMIELLPLEADDQEIPDLPESELPPRPE